MQRQRPTALCLLTSRAGSPPCAQPTQEKVLTLDWGSVVGSTRALDEPSVKTASAHFLARPSGEGSNLPICSVPPLPAPGHYIYFFVCV